MPRIAVAACAALALLALAGPATAHDASFPTRVVLQGTDREPPTSDSYYAFGRVESARRCLDGRRVKVYFNYVPARRGAEAPRDWTLVDVARTSRNGAWAGSGPIGEGVGGVNAIKLRATRKQVVRRGHEHVCRADTGIFPLA